MKYYGSVKKSKFSLTFADWQKINNVKEDE